MLYASSAIYTITQILYYQISLKKAIRYFLLRKAPFSHRSGQVLPGAEKPNTVKPLGNTIATG